jgi:hypothetical protein
MKAKYSAYQHMSLRIDDKSLGFPIPLHNYPASLTKYASQGGRTITFRSSTPLLSLPSVQVSTGDGR